MRKTDISEQEGRSRRNHYAGTLSKYGDMDFSRIISFEDDQDISTGHVSVAGNLTPNLRHILTEIKSRYNRCPIANTWPIINILHKTLKSGEAEYYNFIIKSNPEWRLNTDIKTPVVYQLDGDTLEDVIGEFITLVRDDRQRLLNYEWPKQLAKGANDRWKEVNQLDVLGELTDVYETFLKVVYDIERKYFGNLNESVESNRISFDDDLNTSTGHISLSHTEYSIPEFKTNIDVVNFLKKEYGTRNIDILFDGAVDGYYDIVFSRYGRIGELWCEWKYKGDLSLDPQVWVDMFKSWAREIRSGENFDLCDRVNTDDTWDGDDKKHDEFMEYVRNATQEIVMVMDGHYPQANSLNESVKVHNLVTFDDAEDDTSTGFVNVSHSQPETKWKVFKDFRSWFFFIARLLEKKRIIVGYDDEIGYEEDDDEDTVEYTRYRLQFSNGKHVFGPRYFFFGVNLYDTEDKDDPDYAYYCFKQELGEEIESIENGNYRDIDPSVLEGMKYIEDIIVKNTRYHGTVADGSHLFMRIPPELEDLLNESVQTKLFAFDEGTDVSLGFVDVSDNMTNKVSYADLFGSELMFEKYMEKFFNKEFERYVEINCYGRDFDVRVEPENITVCFKLSDDFQILSDDEKIADITAVIKEDLDYPDIVYDWFYDTEQDPDDSRDEETWADEVMGECKHIKWAFEEFVKTVENGLKTGHLKHLDESLNLMSFDDEEDTSTGFISAGGHRRASEPISGIRFLKWMYENGGYSNGDGFSGSWKNAETEEDLDTLDIDCYAEEHYGGGGYDYPEDATVADFIDMFEGDKDCWFEYFYNCWGGPVIGQTFLEGDMKCKLYNDYESFVGWLDDIENMDVEKYIRDSFGQDIDDYAFMMIEKEYGEDYYSKIGPEGISRIMNGYRDDFVKGALEPITKGFQGLVEKGRKLLNDYRIYCSTLDK